MRAVQNVTVRITDVSTDSPAFSQSVFNASIPENNAIGTHIVTVTAMDRDRQRNATIVYELDPEVQGSNHVLLLIWSMSMTVWTEFHDENFYEQVKLQPNREFKIQWYSTANSFI